MMINTKTILLYWTQKVSALLDLISFDIHLLY